MCDCLDGYLCECSGVDSIVCADGCSGTFLTHAALCRVLDVTCSAKRKWPAFAHVRSDISSVSKPDVVADAKHLPFADSSFSDIYCDPPFNVYRTGSVRDGRINRDEAPEYHRFSHFEVYADWLHFVRATDIEFSRVLIPNGLLHYKLPDGVRPNGKRNGACISQSDLSLMRNFERIWDEQVPTRGPFVAAARARGFRRLNVHYVTLRNLKSYPPQPSPAIALGGEAGA